MEHLILQPKDIQEVPRWKKEDMLRTNAFFTDKKGISFDKHDRENDLDPHHDGLVITLYVANHFIQKKY